MTPDLDYLFNPNSVAVIGVSLSPLKWGPIILKHIIRGGYKGKIYPINPKGGEIQKLRLLSLSIELKEGLQQRRVSKKLMEIFKKSGHTLSDQAQIQPISSKEWKILDGEKEYTVKESNKHLNVYPRLKIYPSLKEVSGEIDLAIIAIPAATVPSVFSECIEKGVKTAVIISSGFGEAGKKGKRAEEELSLMAKEGNLPFVGPNSMGIFSSSSNLNALMPAIRPLKGNVSFVAQSGNLGVQMLDRGVYYGVGFDKFVSSGNEACLRCEDFIDYFRKNPSTKVILAYVEGIKDGRKFLEIAKETTTEKPIIAIKAGKTKAGKTAASSHTGALTGSREVYNAVFKQTGIIEAETTEEMLKFALAFDQPLPKNNKVAIITRGGGWGVIVADACNRYGIEVPSLPTNLLKKLNEILPFYWSRGNPVDMVAERDPSIGFKILDAVEDWDVGGMIILGGVGAFAKRFVGHQLRQVYEDSIQIPYAKKIIGLSKRGKTVFGVAFEPLDRSKPIKLLRKNKIPIYYAPEEAARAYSKLIEYKNIRERKRNII